MKVCMVVPNTMVKGGIAAVVNGYRGSRLEKDYEIHYVESYCDGTKFQKLIKAIRGYLRFLLILFIVHPDIVHIHSSFGPSFYRKLPFIYMANWFHKPIINHIHGADFDEFYINASSEKQKLIRNTYLMCSKLIALSAEWREKLKVIVPESRIVVIENYSILCPEALKQRLERPSNNIVLFLGELGKRKGCYDIPAVIEKVLETVPDIQFILAGDGTKLDKQRIENSLRVKDVEKHVNFSGWVRDKEKDILLRNADIFFLPSYNEGMPMSILDAMGYGLPIVSTNVGGIPKIVENGRNGFCLTPGDIDEMANAISSLLRDSQMLKSMGGQSYKIIKDRYTLEKHIIKLENLYRVVGTTYNP